MKRGLARSGATISFEPVSVLLLFMPISFGCVEAVDEQPGKDIGHLVRARAYLLVAQQAQHQKPEYGPGHGPCRQRLVRLAHPPCFILDRKFSSAIPMVGSTTCRR